MFYLRSAFVCLMLSCLAVARAGEFIEEFNGDELRRDSSARDGWTYQAGDGRAAVGFSQADGIGLIEVDARADQRNLWWAYIRRSVSDHIDSEELSRPDRELRVEAKIRVDAAPRRVNLHFNHSRTTDYHSHLMEYDIPDTANWHVISLTTQGFDALPDDEVFVQMALMDWGRDRYRVEIDYLKVHVVDPVVADGDLGEPLPYRPPIPPLASFGDVVKVTQAGIVDVDFPMVGFRDWTNRSVTNRGRLIAVGGSQIVLLRWNLRDFVDRVPDGWGVLELTTEQVYWADTGLEEFGELRIVEILGGDPEWDRETLTLERFLAGSTLDKALNGQMIMDVPPAMKSGDKTLIGISPPVLRRLLSGQTLGLAIYGQGAVYASFFAGDDEGPKLYLNLESAQ